MKCCMSSTGTGCCPQTPEEAAALLQEIEGASRLKATGLVNNSHLGWKPPWKRFWEAWTSPTGRLS